MEERLNKLIARAGLASRRGADALIEEGRVTINGKVVTELGMRVDPEEDDVRVDGERLHPERVPDRYFALYKPRQVITTASDPLDRPTVMEYIDPDVRLFPVGRLDATSEGLIILTNDGELANRLTHPRYEHEKEYRVKISGTPTEKALQSWREGVYLEDGRTLPARVTVESSSGGGTWLRFVLREGKNRQIRRMVETFKHSIHRLIRVRMGPVVLGNLKPGEWRRLTAEEVAALQQGSNEPVLDPGSPTPEAGRQGERPRYKEGWARPKARPKPKSRAGPARGGKNERNQEAPRGGRRRSDPEAPRGGSRGRDDRSPRGR
jgi:23S rRNA pseudouridine2605 synthase